MFLHLEDLNLLTVFHDVLVAIGKEAVKVTVGMGRGSATWGTVVASCAPQCHPACLLPIFLRRKLRTRSFAFSSLVAGLR